MTDGRIRLIRALRGRGQVAARAMNEGTSKLRRRWRRDAGAYWQHETRRRPWRCSWFVAACLIEACAEAPDGTAFFEARESSVAPPASDLEAGSSPPGTPGAWSPDVIIPPIPIRDASVPIPGMDAALSGPVDAGSDTGAPRATMDATSAPADAARDVSVPPSDATMPPPTVQTCATTPTYPTPDACSECICSRCAAQVNTCYASNEPAKNQQCKAVRDCAQANHCTGNGCYCGDDPFCLLPAGPCAQVIQSAAGIGDVTAAAADPRNPVGRSNQVGVCEMANCATECGL